MTADNAPKELDRSRKVGAPINFANTRQNHVRTARLWPPEFENAKKTTRGWLLALREYVNNTYQSLRETKELTEATIRFRFNLKYLDGKTVDWENSSLIISDNAGGMTAERLAEALQLNSEQLHPEAAAGGNYADVSLNRHGCGMKSSTVQLAAFMSSVKYIATRAIGAECGYGFMYFDDSIPGENFSTQIYEDNNIFPAGTHGVEIYIKGLSDVWPRKKKFGTELYVPNKAGKTYEDGTIKLETTSSSVLGLIAQHLGFYYAWWLAGRRLQAPPEPPAHQQRTWAENGFQTVKDEKQLHIVLEVWEDDWTTLICEHKILPLFSAWDPKLPPPKAMTIKTVQETASGEQLIRSGTILLGRTKASSDYTYTDGPAPADDDLRFRQQKPFYHQLRGLNLFELGSVFNSIKSINATDTFVPWAGCVFDTAGFCTNTEKTGVITDTLTISFYDDVAAVVKKQVSEWTQEYEDKRNELNRQTAELEAAYRDAYVEKTNKEIPAFGPRPYAKAERPLKARVVPAANDIMERLQEFLVTAFPTAYAKMPLVEMTEDIKTNIEENTLPWLKDFLTTSLAGGDKDEHGRELDSVADSLLRAYSGDEVLVGRADVLVQRDLKIAPVSSMTPEARNAARDFVVECKPRYASAGHVFQLLCYMLVPKNTDTVAGTLLARGFTVGSMAAACFLRALGFKINLLTFAAAAVETEKSVPPVNELSDDGLHAHDRGDPKLTVMTMADRRVLAPSFDLVAKTVENDEKPEKRAKNLTKVSKKKTDTPKPELKSDNNTDQLQLF